MDHTTTAEKIQECCSGDKPQALGLLLARMKTILPDLNSYELGEVLQILLGSEAGLLSTLVEQDAAQGAWIRGVGDILDFVQLLLESCAAEIEQFLPRLIEVLSRRFGRSGLQRKKAFCMLVLCERVNLGESLVAAQVPQAMVFSVNERFEGQSVRAVHFQLIGRLCRRYPELMTDYQDAILNAVKATDKDSITVQLGALLAVEGFLYHFISAVSPKDKPAIRLLCLRNLDVEGSLAIQAAALRVVSRHAGWLALETQNRAQMWQLLPRHPAVGEAALQAVYAALRGSVENVENILKEEILIQLERDGAAYMREAAIRCMQALGRHGDAAVHLDRWSLCLLQLFHTTLGLDRAANESLEYAGFDLKLVKAFEECKAVIHCVAELNRSEVSLQRYTELLNRCRLLLEAVIKVHPLCPLDRRRPLVAEPILIAPECVRDKIISKQLEECSSTETAELAKLLVSMLDNVAEELNSAAQGVLGQLASHVLDVLRVYSQSDVKIDSPDVSYLSNVCTVLTSTLHLVNVRGWILNQLETLLDRLLDCLNRHGGDAALLRLLASLVVLAHEEQVLESCSGWLAVKLGRVLEALDVNGHANKQNLCATCEVLLTAPAGLLQRRHFEKILLALEVMSENPNENEILTISLSRLDDWITNHDHLDLDRARRSLRKLECSLDCQNKESRMLKRRIGSFLDKIGISNEELQTEPCIQDICQLPLPGYSAFKMDASRMVDCVIERGDTKSVTAVSLMLCCSAEKEAAATLILRCLARLARSGDILAVQLTQWSQECGKWQPYVDCLLLCLWQEVHPVVIDNCVTVLVQCCQHSIDCGRGNSILDYIIKSLTALLNEITRNTGVLMLLSKLLPMVRKDEEIIRKQYPALLLQSLTSFTELPDLSFAFDILVKELIENISVFTPEKLLEFLGLLFTAMPKAFSADLICKSMALAAEIFKKLQMDPEDYIIRNQVDIIRCIMKDLMDLSKQNEMSKMDIDNGETLNAEFGIHRQKLMSRIGRFLCFLTNLVVQLKVDVLSLKKVLVPELLLEFLGSSGAERVNVKQWNSFCECLFDYFIVYKVVLIPEYANIVSQLLSQLLIKQPANTEPTRKCRILQKKCYEKYLDEHKIAENVKDALVQYIRSGSLSYVLGSLEPNCTNANAKPAKVSLQRLGSIVALVPAILAECSGIVETSRAWLKLVLNEQWSDVDMEKVELFKVALNTSLEVLFISKTELSINDLGKFVTETDELKMKLHSAPGLLEIVLERGSSSMLVDAALEYVVAKRRIGDLDVRDVNILDRVCKMWADLQTSAENPQHLQHMLRQMVTAGATPAQLEAASSWLAGRLAELGSGCTEGAALMELLPRVVETFDGVVVKQALRSYRASIPLRQWEYEGHVPLALRTLALGICARPALLPELLAVLTDTEPAPWWRQHLANCMRELAGDASMRVASARLLWGRVCARDTHAPLRLVIARALLVPLVASCPSDACDELFLEMKDGLVHLVMAKPSESSNHQMTSLLLGYIVGYTLAEVLILKVNAELLKSASALGSEGNWPFCRGVLAAFRIRRDMEPPSPPGATAAEEKLLACYYREFYQAGMRCSTAALTRRESEWKSYEPLYRVQDLRKVVDEDRLYRVRLQADNAKWSSVKDAKAHQSRTRDKIFLSTLSDNVLQYDFIQLEESATGKDDVQVHTTSSSDSHDLESHPCLAAFIVMTTKGEHSATSMLRDALADSKLLRNVRLFAAQIICSSADSLQIHQKDLRCAILRAVESRWGYAKEVVNSVDVQLLKTLISWWEPDLEYSHEEQTVASRILEMLVEMTAPVFEDRKVNPSGVGNKTEVEQKGFGTDAENVTAAAATSTASDVHVSDKAHVDTYLNRAGRRSVLALITDLAMVWSGFIKPPTTVLRKMLSGSEQDHAFTILSLLLKAGLPVDSLLHQLFKFLDDARKPIAKAAAETLSAGMSLCRIQHLRERCGRDLRKKLEGCYAKDPMEYVGLLQGLLKGNAAFECCDEDVMYLSDLIPKVSPGTRNRCLTCLHQLLKSQRELACCDTLHTLDYPGILLEPECTDAALEVVQCVIRQLSAELRAATLAAVLETCAVAASQRRLLCYQILLSALDCEAVETETESGTPQGSRKRRLGEDVSSAGLPAWMKLSDGAVLRQLSRGIADEDCEVANFVLNSLSEMMAPFSRFRERFRVCAHMPTAVHGTLRLLFHSSETPTDKLSAEPLIAVKKHESNNEEREGFYPDVQIPLSSVYGTLLRAAQLDEAVAKAWLRAVIKALLKEGEEDNPRRPLADVQSSLLGDAVNTDLAMLFNEEWQVYNDEHAREIGAKRKPFHV